MPEISRFFGIVITMHFREHAPAHFHVRYAGFRASVGIDPLLVLEGRLPARVQGLVVEWAAIHEAELLEDWARAGRHETLRRIEPLE